ncbi:MAG: hypothetical protein V4563_14980 [Pseudomonadota bacterium]
MSDQQNDYMGNPNGRQGRAFQPLNRRGYTVIDVLQFLNGKPWDAVALAYVHALRPSHLRVVTTGIQLDAQTWRVTVWLNPDGKTIKHIEQEVEVGLPEGIEHGENLRRTLEGKELCK